MTTPPPTLCIAEASARDGATRSICEVEGHAIAYVEAGRGPAVLLIHGALTNLDDMVLGPFQALARDHRVLAFDRPGHGESPRLRLADASPWRQAELIHAAACDLGAESPVVVGHSFGGAVALAYGMSFPQETRGVLALAPIVWPEPRLELAAFGMRAMPGPGDILAACASGTVDHATLPLLWRAMFLPQAMPPHFQDGFSFDRASAPQTTLSTGEDAFAIVTALWRSVAAYPSCRTPVSILGGDCDLVINNALHGLALSGVLPDGRFKFVRGMGHMLHHFAIDEVLAAVRALEATAAMPV
ncbi:alpha/beta fold hydrolase [Caulobacter sp. S45]|uniref:alpha/beta fold hydrolase n=1 Tax=Caulobacter sp. S45 TaxID=1641861 RepID=UPI00157706C4|nr:alpha/beta hydrolase [Caulobacter sp. S45]